MFIISNNRREKPDEAREKLTGPIKCSCGQVGSAIWEENAGLSPQWPQPLYLEVSSGFYLRVQKNDIARTEIACDVCDSIVTD